jgi:hypothetical protein
MADEKIYVESSFENILIVNPNKIINSDNNPEDRNVRQEDLVMYANLECNLQPRSRLLVGENDQTLQTIAISSVNFLKPNNQDYLTTNWTELQSNVLDSNVVNSELLGITNISYKCGASFVPTVDVKLEDVRGRALFESGNDSIYSVFFNLPYPTFYLTLKGYYGKAIKYPLILQRFQASFDSSSGNFLIDLNFLGYKYNVLSDISQGYILAVPNMYTKVTNTQIQTDSASNTDASVDQINSDNVPINSTITQRGYEQIKEMYKIYKSKGLLEENFPELTVQQLILKLENFEKNILQTIGTFSVEKLTDAKTYNKILSNYLLDVVTAKSGTVSWKFEFLDTKKFFIVKDEKDGKYYEVYTYKENFINYDEALSKLKSIITAKNSELDNCPTFGRESGKGPEVINFSISEDNIYVDIEPIAGGGIDVDETAKRRNVQNSVILSELETIKQTRATEYERRLNLNIEPSEVPFLFKFDGTKYFVNEINELQKILQNKTENIQKELTAEINLALKSEKGIGFEPSVRNIIGVIMASTDSFLRLMDEVHKKAFDSRFSEEKKQSVLQDVLKYPDSPVYPWPQYAKEELTDDGQVKYDLKYPGDRDYIQETGAENFDVWPEVEFVEEFVKGFTQRQQPPLNVPEQNNETKDINRLLISGFDNLTNLSYSDPQDIGFLYEIYERITAISEYDGFVRDEKYGSILNLLQAFENTNIIKGLGNDDVSLINLLKNDNQVSNAQNYRTYLNKISLDGNGQFAQNLSGGNINTVYLKSEIEPPSSIIYDPLPNVTAEISGENNSAEIEKTMVDYLKLTDKNQPVFTDTFPFVIEEWNLETLNAGEENSNVSIVLNTSKSIFYDYKIKKIVNYSDNKFNKDKNIPLKYFVDTTKPFDYSLLNSDIINFYFYDRGRKLYTEGGIFDYTTNLDGTETVFFNKATSIINTPIFVQSISNGIVNFKNKSTYPFIQAAFLFLNSLPLSNPSYRYINLDKTYNNYIGPSLKKFGAYHTLPRLWICKIGSLWYRYKTYIETGSDFMSSAQLPIDFTTSYDPGGAPPSENRLYNFLVGSDSYSIVMKQSQLVGTETLEMVNVGFYPKILDDFHYFLNGSSLYSDVTDIQNQIQNKIDLNEVKIYSNSNSQIDKPSNVDAGVTTSLSLKTFSVLYKSRYPNLAKSEGEYWFSTPSFGSRYNQTSAECFEGPIQIKDVFDNPAVYNGSVRLLWGGTHFGYQEDFTIGLPDSYFGFNSSDSWYLTLYDTEKKLDGDYIDDLFGTFTKQELDLFETEFLNFSKSALQSVDEFNIQTLLRKALQIKKEDFEIGDQNNQIQKFQEKQQVNFNSIVQEYINKNVIFKKGNPTNYDKKSFAYFSNTPYPNYGNDVGSYNDLTPNSVPTNADDSITLNNSIQTYTNQWNALRTHVGFFNYTGFTYSDTGSYITDFFPDNDIAFTVSNIERFASVIKIYATRKYFLESDNPAESFQTEMSDYLNSINNFRDNIFNGVITKLRKGLPSLSNVGQVDEKSATEGGLTKLEYYNLFKSINDKWVAGNNYNSETLFEDILFLDRANRNIGSKVIVDVFNVAKYLKGNPTMSVYTIVTSICESNNFVTFSMPSYINFYNVQKIGQEYKIEEEGYVANKLFGTFTDVDYQDSKTKLVFQYTNLPSEQLDNQNTSNGFNNDSFNLGVSTNNPLVERIDENKNDYGLSNKVVGFAVDFGLQNQGVFTNVQVSQDIGKATSESLQMEYDLANLNSGTKSSTQSVSLYNIYKSRSYSSTVTSFGNVMIQPTMYFVLRSIPLFAGPYMITDIEHTITPQSFTTKLVGTRQKLYTLPIQNPLLETIKSNFVEKLVNNLVTKRQTEKTLDANTKDVSNTLANNLTSDLEPSPNPICKPAVTYNSYTAATPTLTVYSASDLWDSIFTKYSTSTPHLYMIYTLFYIPSFDGTSFSCYNNNLSETPLGSGTPSYGPGTNTFLKKNYICMNGNDNKSQAFATFEGVNECIDFNYSRYKDVFKEVLKPEILDNEDLFVSGFTKTWIEKVPYDKTNTSNLYESFQLANPTTFENLKNKVSESYKQVKVFLE